MATLDLGELLCDVVQIDLQRQWAARCPDIELQLIRTNSSTGGLAEGLCDLAVVTTGRCVGITPESTVTQYRRQASRSVRCATPPRSRCG